MMATFWEGRSSACYICKYFVQNVTQFRNGICFKHPPQKIDENLGAPIAGAPAGYKIFPNIIDPLTGCCGDFEIALIMPTDVDDPPPIEPPA